MRNRSKWTVFVVAVLSIASATLGAVRADSMAYVVAHDYVGTGGGPDIFGQIDLNNGKFTLISDLPTSPYSIFGMAFGAGGQIYGLGYNFNSPSSPSKLFSIDPTTGATTDLGLTTFSSSAAAGNGDGVLYALDGNNTTSLHSLIPPSTSSSLIGGTSIAALDGLMAIDSLGRIFASGDAGILYEINPMNASTTPIGDTGEGFGLYAGTFVGSTLYGFTPSDTIVTIDTTNAGVTPGPTYTLPSDNYAVVAAAAMPAAAVPEPTSLLLGSIGALAVFACGLMRNGARVERGRAWGRR